MCHISTGDKGHFEIPSERLVKIREEEARHAASVIGATSLCLNYTDCEVFHNDESVRKMAGIIREVRPDLIITHASNDYVPDHRATSRIVFDASFHATLPYYKAAGNVFEKVVPLYYMDTLAGVEFLYLIFEMEEVCTHHRRRYLHLSHLQVSWGWMINFNPLHSSCALKASSILERGYVPDINFPTRTAPEAIRSTAILCWRGTLP